MFRSIIITALSLLLLTWFLPGVSIAGDSFNNAGFWVVLLVTSVIMSFLFGIVKPILSILTLPINIVTLGLFSALLNIFLLWFTVYLVPSFVITQMTIFGIFLNYFLTLLFVSVLLGFAQSFVRSVIK